MTAVLVARRPMCCGIEMASEVPASQAARHGWRPPRNNCAPLGCLRFPGKPCHQHHAPGGFRNNCAPHLQLPRILPPVGSPFLSTHSRLVQHLHGHDLGRIHFFLHTVHWCAGCAEYFCRTGPANHSRETRFCFVTLWKRRAQITFGAGHQNGALERSPRQSDVESWHSRGSKIRVEACGQVQGMRKGTTSTQR